MLIILQILILLEEWVTCTIGGLTYMDKVELKGQSDIWSRVADSCKPLNWYPRHVPEYCHYKNIINPPPGPPIAMAPTPVPIPVPLPMPILSIPGGPFPYPPMRNLDVLYHQKQTGMVPGLPGLVSPDGGLNILPFSDAYSDMLENHKQKMLKKRFRELVDDYEDYPRRRRRSRKRKKHTRRHIGLLKYS